VSSGKLLVFRPEGVLKHSVIFEMLPIPLTTPCGLYAKNYGS